MGRSVGRSPPDVDQRKKAGVRVPKK